jgi:hypothetical protein
VLGPGKSAAEAADEVATAAVAVHRHITKVQSSRERELFPFDRRSRPLLQTAMSHSGFKLDMGCVERDEYRCEFLSACSRLDEKIVCKMVDVRGIDAATALDPIGQNCIHFVTCSSVVAAACNLKNNGTSSTSGRVTR